MIDAKYLKASNGNGDAVTANIMATRTVGSLILTVDSVDNFPDFFIATTGTINQQTGYITNATKTEFKGKVVDGKIHIESFEPGFTDIGNTTGQVLIIKPTSGWANGVAEHAEKAGMGKDISGADKYVKFSTAGSQPSADPNHDIIWFKPV